MEDVGQHKARKEDVVKRHNRKTHASILVTVVTVFSRLVAIPVFILAHKNLPNPSWAFHIDRILLLIAVFGLLEILLKWMRNFVVICLFVATTTLAIGSLSGNYGFSDLVRDYQAMVVGMYESPRPQEVISSKLVLYPNRSKILKAIDFENPVVRDFSMECISKNFATEQKHTEYRQLVQCFAVFKEINSRWNYVSDPKGTEYFASASESIRHLAGDCDDHSILMAACVKSIGGTARLVHAEGHLYPEILIGKKTDMEKVNFLIKKELFEIESKGKSLHYHTDENGRIWLNLDYTARYPGGSFMTEKNLGVINL